LRPRELQGSLHETTQESAVFHHRRPSEQGWTDVHPPDAATIADPPRGRQDPELSRLVHLSEGAHRRVQAHRERGSTTLGQSDRHGCKELPEIRDYDSQAVTAPEIPRRGG